MYGGPVDVIPIDSESIVENLGVADCLGDVEWLLLSGRSHIQPTAEACSPLLQPL